MLVGALIPSVGGKYSIFSIKISDDNVWRVFPVSFDIIAVGSTIYTINSGDTRL